MLAFTMGFMSQTAELSTAEAISSLCGDLQPDHQTSLLQFAKFLKSQEELGAFDEVDEEDEVGWDQVLGDPARVAKFEQWADQSLASSPPRPIDPKRL